MAAMQALVAALLLTAAHVVAYIPAVPTNDTQSAVNQSDMSMLTMLWAPAGVYTNTISFQLAANRSDGFTQGALVHFSERNLTDKNTTTPWIALVNCDANTTDASQEDDIFTLARDRGAGGALLYSLTSEACLINPEYASPDNFEQILDIYATQSKFTARIINSQFSNLRNASYGNYNAVLMNNSADSVMASLHTGNITSPFIVATLRAANSTISPNGTDTTTPPPQPTNDSPSRSNPNTGLAMIILYAITGCVSALFIVVILSGAVRAIRHPERYGPRDANGAMLGMPAQSRTGGIGRAILDTFPIIKFGQTTTTTPPEAKRPDLVNQTDISRSMEMGALAKGARERTQTGLANASVQARREDEQETRTAAVAARATDADSNVLALPAASGSATTSIPTTPDEEAGSSADEVKPGAIGHETCPICIVDFQEGDDLRVLPCEGKHKFHQNCVDPWLLDLSSSCPLCREDFHALETMLAGNEATQAEDATAITDSPTLGARSSRFSKYLRFARRHHSGQPQPEPYDQPYASPGS